MARFDALEARMDARFARVDSAFALGTFDRSSEGSPSAASRLIR